MMDPDDKPRPEEIAVPRPLDTLSIGELEDYIALLEGELARVRSNIAAKQAARGGAEGFFKR